MIPQKLLQRLLSDESGVGSVLMIVLLPMFIGLAGLAIDGAAAYRMQTILQATADASAHAAAIDLPDTTKAAATAVTYATKNLPVASNGNVLVSSDIVTGTWNKTARTFTAGGATPNAIQVTVRRAAANGNALPTSFLGIIGRSSWDVSASATAAQANILLPICMLSLATSGTGFNSNGGNSLNFNNCTVMSNSTSNTAVNCNGHPLTPPPGAVDVVVAGDVASNSKCSSKTFTHVTAAADPYAGLASHIPSNTCGAAKNYSYEPTATTWSTSRTLGSAVQICGDLQLTGDVTLTTPAAGSLLVIENGQLDLNGHTLKTANGSALTIIFSGDAADNHSHIPTSKKNGTLDFNAPTSGTWSGIAMYQDPVLTKGLNVSYDGNNPTWDLTGVVYMPKSNMSFSGAVNKSSNGQSCFVTVANTVQVSGTGAIYQQLPGGCAAAGVTPPSASVPAGWQIVM